MVIEFFMSVVAVLCLVSAIVMWLSSAVEGFKAIILLSFLLAISLITLIAFNMFAISTVDALRLVLLIGLPIAPFFAVFFYQHQSPKG